MRGAAISANKRPHLVNLRPIRDWLILEKAGLRHVGFAQSGCSPVANNEQQCVNVAIEVDREG